MLVAPVPGGARPPEGEHRRLPPRGPGRRPASRRGDRPTTVGTRGRPAQASRQGAVMAVKLRDHQVEAAEATMRGLEVPSGGVIPREGLRAQVPTACGTAAVQLCSCAGRSRRGADPGRQLRAGPPEGAFEVALQRARWVAPSRAATARVEPFSALARNRIRACAGFEIGRVAVFAAARASASWISPTVLLPPRGLLGHQRLVEDAEPVRAGFATSALKTSRPAAAPKPSRPGPGRPRGSSNRTKAPRHTPGKTIKGAETLDQHYGRTG